MRAIADGATHVAPRESGRQRIIAPRSVRESRRGGRDAIRPNAPGSKRNKLHGPVAGTMNIIRLIADSDHMNGLA